MTEITEPVCVQLPPQHQKGECPFCKTAKKDGAKTIYEGKSDDLGTDLKNEPDWTIKDVTISGKTYHMLIHSVPNAHHLIPAEAALHGERFHTPHPSGNVLPKHAIMAYMSASAKGTKVTADIGYDVNKKHNGVWLPSIPSEFKGDDPDIVKWGPDLPAGHKYSVAERFMKEPKVNRQWHQTHTDYSDRVEQWLQGFVENLKKWKLVTCPDVKKNDPPFPPPLGLLTRLKALSRYLRGYLVGERKGWRTPMFTSTQAETYYSKK
jgi:hypothetical protein